MKNADPKITEVSAPDNHHFMRLTLAGLAFAILPRTYLSVLKELRNG
jgi:hypothetical protein